MLTLLGPQFRYCDGLSRRSFLTIGGLAMGGLTLPQLLAAEDRSRRRSHKAVIMVYLSGGLAHQDTFDLKPDAPSEVRGEFKPIDSNVPGVRVCELLPKMAKVMDKVAVIRSIVGLRDEHSSWQNLTGYPMPDAQREGKPVLGSVIARVQGPTDPIVPPFIDLFPTMQHKPYNSGNAGVLGRKYDQVKADGEAISSMKLRYVDRARLDDRKQLLAAVNRFQRSAEQTTAAAATSQFAGFDVAQQRAFDVLTTSKLVDAIDVGREDHKVRERYGLGSSKHQGDGAPQWNDQLLVARRLVEAGVRCVTVAHGFWDTHGQNFRTLKRQLPMFDTGISALVEDIYSRGLDKDVTVVVWGEFGRTPKINKDAGRDHWPTVSNAILFGGSMRVGQVIGSTDKTAARAQDRPVHYQDVLATIYHNLGIDPHELVRDQTDRPIPILPSTARVIQELV